MLLRTTLALAFVLVGHRVQTEEDAEKEYQECTELLKTKYAGISKNRCCNLLSSRDDHRPSGSGHHGEQCHSASPGEELKKETRTLHQGLWGRLLTLHYSLSDEEECITNAKCEDSVCMLRTRGVMTAHGKLDFKKAEEFIDFLIKMHPDSKDMMERVKETCTEANIKLLSNTDCPAYDLQACMVFVGIPACTDFNTEDKDCMALHKIAVTCEKTIEKLVTKNTN